MKQRVRNEMDNIKDFIKKRVHELYYGIDMNCARTTITCISEILDIEIENQTMDAALGMHGAGGFRAQCGLVEGSLMLIGIYGKINKMPEQEIVEACYHYGEQFISEFGAMTCKELRPGGFKKNDPPHLCEQLTNRSIYFTYRYLNKWIDHKNECEINLTNNFK